jgi:hypothetical protein
MAAAIKAAIRPYSMAVTPDSSATNLRIVFMAEFSNFHFGARTVVETLYL